MVKKEVKKVERKKIIGIILIAVVIVSALLVMFFYNKNNSVGIANPAATYCINSGYTTKIISNNEGETGYCVNGEEECEEWAYFRGECSFSDTPKCVPDSCCHAFNCVEENQSPNCTDIMCTMVCQEGTMDCGAGHCAYVNGNCEVVWNNESK